MSQQPASPLPWFEKHANIRAGDDFVASFFLAGDAMYADHACNAYPRLVEALRDTYNRAPLHCTKAGMLLRELGETE